MSNISKTIKLALLMGCLCLFSGCYNSVNTITYQHIATCPSYLLTDGHGSLGGQGDVTQIYAIYGIANSPVTGTQGSDFTFLLQNIHAGKNGPTPAGAGTANIIENANCTNCFLPPNYQLTVVAGKERTAWALGGTGFALIAVQTNSTEAPDLVYNGDPNKGGPALMVKLDATESKYGSPLPPLQFTDAQDGSLFTTIMPRASAYATDAASF